ncbi:MAG: CDP-glucose 4,6-dehydratase, partial [Bacteroidota bacterium]|nr:CDP-glucose 4,6-dehydratase [Bacteroidota bacterium]
MFVTGHTGFKGAWLSIWLDKLGAVVTGYSKTVNEQQEVFYNDIKSIFSETHYGDIIDSQNLESCI